MSLQEELNEVVKWIADLAAAVPPVGEPLSRHDWSLVQAAIERARGKLADAHSALLEERDQSSENGRKDALQALGELAADLTQRAEDLALRAGMLKQRAKPEPPERAEAAETEAARQKEKESDEEKEAKKEWERRQQTRAASSAPAATPIQRARHLLSDAQRSLGTAHKNLHAVEYPDFVATAFVGELEVLAEMTLKLTQRCERQVPPSPKVS